jgi:hypothetical protein
VSHAKSKDQAAVFRASPFDSGYADVVSELKGAQKCFIDADDSAVTQACL